MPLGQTLLRLFLILIAQIVLAGCASTGTFGRAVDVATDTMFGDDDLGRLVRRGLRTPVSEGIAWDATYIISRSPGHRYSLTSPKLKAPIVMTRAQSMDKLQSIRTDELTADIYSAPTNECPHRYIAILGSSRRIVASAFGCAHPLEFSRGTRDDVYGTEVNAPLGSTPMAYRMTARGMQDPRVVTDQRSHPQHPSNKRRTRRSSNQDPGRPVPTASRPPAPSSRTPRRLPPAERPVLPGEVENDGPDTTRPVVDLGI
jgi:hypothetical protein